MAHLSQINFRNKSAYNFILFLHTALIMNDVNKAFLSSQLVLSLALVIFFVK